MTHRRRWVVPLMSTAAIAVVGWWGFEAEAAPGTLRFTPALLTGALAALTTVALVGGRRRPTDRAPIRLLIAAVLLTVSYFRFLHSPWLAVLGAAVWLASPAFLLVVFTEPSRDGRRLPVRGWTVVLALITAGTLVVSGPATTEAVSLPPRAMSWVWFDAVPDMLIRQPNPLAFAESGGAAIGLSVAWCLTVATVSLLVLRQMAGPWWRLGVLVSVMDSIVLALPVRLDYAEVLLNGAFAYLLVAVPVIGAGLYAAWAVWAELITPRLIRPQALVLQLDRDSTVTATRSRLARALGDPSAAVVFPTDNGWVDESGRRLPHDRPHRRLITVTRNGAAIAALDLDALTEVPSDLLADAAGSLSVSLEARRLAALAEAAAKESGQAHMRLVNIDREAIEEVSNHIEAGPQRTLADVDALLDVRPLPLAEIHDGLRLALEQVRSIAHGAEALTAQQGTQ